ncbi:PREDICTED: prolactin-like [Chinchilla lanigera]|uniref:prolactin-like n=1 Tax=Chinchilla lanigera TaxID=34839 RepID=UPI00038EDBB9|nr:PREDICTED: prolactin-like [Chinchilla lanigera]
MLSLLQCKDVTSLPVCEENCGETYGHLFVPVVSKAYVMYFFIKRLLLDFMMYYPKSQDYYGTLTHSCHTHNIVAPGSDKPNSTILNTDGLRHVVSLMYSWNEPLLHLANETHRLPGNSTYVRDEAIRIAGQNRELQELMKNIATQFDPDITRNVDSAVWTDLPSLQSANEEVNLFTTFNLLRCLLSDSRDITDHLKSFLCYTLKYDKC